MGVILILVHFFCRWVAGGRVSVLLRGGGYSGGLGAAPGRAVHDKLMQFPACRQSTPIFVSSLALL